MPPAIIAALIGAGVTGTEMGLQASGAFQPSTSGATNTAAQTAAAQQKAQEAQQMRAVAGNAQEQAPGLDAASMSRLIAELQGSPGDIGLAQQTVFGGNPSPSGTNVFSGSGASGLATSVG